MTEFETLLELQERDTELDRLRHRIEHHELRGVIAGVEAELGALAAEVAEPESKRADLRRELRRLEDEASGFSDKADREEARMYDGTVTSPKELQALQHEVDSLKALRGRLEDRELELMEALEPLDVSLSDSDARRADLQERLERAGAELTVAIAELESEIAAVTTRRAEVAGDIDADLLSTYDALRRRLGGVAAARLTGNRCEGCHLALPAGELAEVRSTPADRPAFCPECGRILVR